MENDAASPAARPSSGLINRILSDRYELLESLGAGPLLTAFRARDRAANRIVTVKVVQTPFAARADILTLLKTGLSESMGLDHPAIARVFDVGEDKEKGAALYIAEEFVRGIDLKERIRRAAPFQLTAAADTALALGECLEFAHARSVFHGDVRPQNVLIGPDNQVKLSGFGIAPAQNKAVSNHPEQMQRLLLYAAPELALSNAPTASADLYALGIILFEMLTGDVPFKGDNAVQIALRHAQNPVPSPKQVNAAVPRALDGVVQQMLAKLPADRYADMGAFLRDLRLVRDALRYGRSLAWSPLDSAGASTAVPGAAATASVSAGTGTAAASAVPVVAAVVPVVLPPIPAAPPLPVPPPPRPEPVPAPVIAAPSAPVVPFDPYRNAEEIVEPAPAVVLAPAPVPPPQSLPPIPLPLIAPEDATRVMPTVSEESVLPPLPTRSAPLASTATLAAPPPAPIAPSKTVVEPVPGAYVLSDPAPSAVRAGKAAPKDGDRRTRRAAEDKEPPVSNRASKWLTSLNLFFLFLIVAGIGALAYMSLLFFRTATDVVVPNLVGKSLDEAQKMARDQKFELAKVDEQFRDKEPTNTIYQMSPVADRRIREGRSVEIWLSKGPRMVEVPDVRDVSLEKARRLLEGKNLQMGTYVGEYDPLAAKGNVLSQVPAPGENLPRGSRVDLVYSKGEEPAPTPFPDPTPFADPTPDTTPGTNGGPSPDATPEGDADRTRYFDIGYNVPKDGMPHRVRIDVTDKNGPRSVYDESHNAGDKVKFRVEAVGKPIVIKVYDNDQLSKETTQ